MSDPKVGSSRKNSEITDEEETGPLFFRDPDEKEHQEFLKTTEPIYRFIHDDKLYKKGSILRAGYNESVISDVLAKDHYNPHWIEYRTCPKPEEKADESDEDEGPLFFRDPNEKFHQEKMETTDKVYRFIKDDKLYKRGSILRAGFEESLISDMLAPPQPRWVEFKAPPKKEEKEETSGDEEVLFYRDPNELEHQKKMNTTDKIYRHTLDDKLYKEGSILRAGYSKKNMSDTLAKEHYLPHWVEFRPPAKPTKEEDADEGKPLFFRDPNEAENQKLLKTDQKIYRYVVDEKLYKLSSILKVGFDPTRISDEVAAALPRWVEFVKK